MKKNHSKAVCGSLAGAAGVLALAGGALAQDLAGWTLVWQDEFSGSTLDGSKWRAENAALVKNNEQQYYSPANVTLAGGLLTILAERRFQGGRPYTSGLIESRNRFSQSFGRFEVRAKMPSTQGMWPAIWMLPQSGIWPPEIDIMELLGHQPSTMHMTHHWGTWPNVQSETAQFTGPNFADDFYVFAAEWFPDRIDYFVDGVRRARQMNTIPRDAMYLIINTAVGGNWPGNPDQTTVFPQRMEVDYARVYRRNVVNESFEDRGPAANQPLFGWTIAGNSFLDTSGARSGTRLGKMFGNFNGPGNISRVHQDGMVTAGQRWRATSWWLNKSADRMQGTNRGVFKVEWFDAANTAISAVETTALTASSPLNTYVQAAVEATAPAGAVRARLSMVFVQTANLAGAAFFDDVVFERVASGCPADFNGDGTADPDDLADYIGCFFAPACGEGDFNADGAVNPDDLADFIGAFFSACP